MATKKWKYEADCKRIEKLVEDTVAGGGSKGWAACAARVLLTLRIIRPRGTPLALHFLSVSATEMLEKRHDNAKLCLVTAMSMANPVVMAEQQRLFCMAFSNRECADHCTCSTHPQAMSFMSEFMASFKKAVAGLGSKIADLPEGVSEIEVMPGMKAKVIKAKLPMMATATPMKKKKGKKSISLPTGDPRLN